MGINFPERVISKGVRIYNGNLRVVNWLKAIVKDFLKLQVNDGLIKILKEKIIKIPLVKGQ